MWCICSVIAMPTAMSTVLTTPCATMNILLNHILLFILRLPLTTSMGLNLDTTTAGTMPPTSEMTTIAITVWHSTPTDSGIETSASRMSQNTGLMAYASSSPMRKQNVVNTADSLKYRITTPMILSPNRRLVAISLARLPACATVRLI